MPSSALERPKRAGILGGTGTGIPLPNPALPKLNANRGTNLLAIRLAHWKQRASALSNRGEMRVVQLPHHPSPGLIRQ